MLDDCRVWHTTFELHLAANTRDNAQQKQKRFENKRRFKNKSPSRTKAIRKQNRIEKSEFTSFKAEKTSSLEGNSAASLVLRTPASTAMAIAKNATATRIIFSFVGHSFLFSLISFSLIFALLFGNLRFGA